MSGELKVRFGDFVLDSTAYRLERGGRRVPIERRPMDVLMFLVERAGRLVTREEIVERFWGADAPIDIDIALNSAIKKARQALRDRAGSPRYIETVQGMGYRFSADVQAIHPAVRAPGAPPMIAVLPFVNFGGGPGRDYVADGFTEEVAAALAQTDPAHLAVIGRTSAMSYKNTTKSLADIGRELNARYLVEGSIRAEGDHLRVTAMLIDAPEQRQIWAESFDSQPVSLLQLQRDVSRSVAEQIRITISPEAAAAVARRHSQNAAAYNLYLQGRHAWHQLTGPTNRRALECYARATALDPNYALAWSGISDAYSASVIKADARPQDVSERARAAAASAIAADPDLAESQTSLGLVEFWFNRNWRRAELAQRKAISLDASYGFAHLQLGIVLAYRGFHDEARDAMRRARELDPLWAMTHALSAHVEFVAGDYDRSLSLARQATAIHPGFWIAGFHLAQAYERLGELDTARAALGDEGATGRNSKMLSLRGYLLARSGEVERAREVLAALEAISRERYLPPYSMALVHAGLGETDAALHWLERALDARDVHLIFLTVDPKWDTLRGEGRFQALVDRCGFAAKM
jgi:TolB-like protein/Flp pilus assembly protein TadD